MAGYEQVFFDAARGATPDGPEGDDSRMDVDEAARSMLLDVPEGVLNPPVPSADGVAVCAAAADVLINAPAASAEDDALLLDVFGDAAPARAMDQRSQSKLVELGILQRSNPLLFETCPDGCTRGCLQALWLRDAEFLQRVVETGQRLASKMEAYKYGNSEKHSKSKHRRRTCSSSSSTDRAEKEGLDGGGGAAAGAAGLARTADDWLEDVYGLEAARDRQNVFIDVYLHELLNTYNVCIGTCIRLLGLRSKNKLYWRPTKRPRAGAAGGVAQDEDGDEGAARSRVDRCRERADQLERLMPSAQLSRVDVKTMMRCKCGGACDCGTNMSARAIEEGRLAYKSAARKGRACGNRWLMTKLWCFVFQRKSDLSKTFVREWLGVPERKTRSLRRAAELAHQYGDSTLQTVFFSANVFHMKRTGGPKNKLPGEVVDLIYDYFDMMTVILPGSDGVAVLSDADAGTHGQLLREFKNRHRSIRISTSTLRREKKKWLAKNDLRRIVAVKPDHNVCPKCKNGRAILLRALRWCNELRQSAKGLRKDGSPTGAALAEEADKCAEEVKRLVAVCTDEMRVHLEDDRAARGLMKRLAEFGRARGLTTLFHQDAKSAIDWPRQLHEAVGAKLHKYRSSCQGWYGLHDSSFAVLLRDLHAWEPKDAASILNDVLLFDILTQASL